jgi:hypothetical protein
MKRFWMLALAAMALAGPLATAGSAQENAVMLVVPSRYSVMQVAFDVARRYPTVIVSYQGGIDEPALHVWNGFEWLPLSLADYQSGAFLQTYPDRAILLGDDSLLPTGLRSIGTWCSNAVQLPDLETHQLVNGIGRYLPFTPADWRWFAGRYNLQLTNLRAEEAEAARRETWYDQSAPVEDSKPGFFKYFTRSRRADAKAAQAPIVPAEPAEGDFVDIPAEP